MTIGACYSLKCIFFVFSYREAELNGTQGDDEDAEEDGDGAVADDLSGGSHDAGLPGTHLVPTPCVEERFLKIPRIATLFHSHTHALKPNNYEDMTTEISFICRQKVFVKMSQGEGVLVLIVLLSCDDCCRLRCEIGRVTFRCLINFICSVHQSEELWLVYERKRKRVWSF